MSFDISYGKPYLKHHGIKGQRWGVQNGPPYPLDKKTYKKAQKLQYSTNKVSNKGFRTEDFRRKHTIPKGTTIYRTTTNPDETTGGPTYVSYLDSDRNHYKGGWIRQTFGGKQTYENTYTLTEDLVVPSRDELYSVIFDKVNDNKDNIRKTCEAWLDISMPEDSVYRMIVAGVDTSTGKVDEGRWKNYVNDVIDNFGNKTLTEAAYYTAQSFGLNNDIRDDVIKELKDRGYNAMTDEASVGGQNGWGREGIDPLIVFDSSVLYKQSSKPIDIYSERVAEAKWEKWTRKADKTKGAWSAFDIRSDELYHHGIEGQRWGVRRFQNEDRTWTEAGKIRYGRKGNGRDGAGYFSEKSGRAVSGGSYFSAKDQRTLDLNTKTHQLNTKVPLIQYGINIVSDILVPNPLYIAMDVSRGARVVTGMIKSNKYSKERERSDIDETTGFHLKNKQLPEKDDIKRVNPDVNDFNSNSKSNCVLCTVATEMRRRGYDVTANKSGTGYYDEEIKRFFPEYKIKTYGRNDIGKEKGAIKATFGLNNKFASDIIDRIEKEQPEGSRGNISVMWGYDLSAGRSIKAAIRGGHSMFYEIKNGKLVISDGQIGKIYKDPQKILKKCSAIQIGRLDNLDFDIEGIKEACR